MGFRLTAHFKSVVADFHPTHLEHAVNQTIQGLHEHGGASVNLHGSAAPSHGYMVGGFAGEKAIKGGPENVTREHVHDFVHENAHHLKDEKNYLGSWHDPEGDKVALDVSRHFSDRKAAHAHARKHNEDAIYNLATGESEPTDWQGHTRPKRERDYA